MSGPTRGQPTVEGAEVRRRGGGRRPGIAPSRIVDEGWHALILHTDLYARLCNRLGGGFVHHYPERPDAGRYDPESVDRTMGALQAVGFRVDRELWVAPDVTLIEVSATCRHAPDCGIKPGPKPQRLPGTTACPKAPRVPCCRMGGHTP